MNHDHQSLSKPELALQRLRRFLLLLLAFEMIGVAAELLLIAHWDGFWQWIPLGLLAAGILALGLLAFWRNEAARRVFQVVMLLCVLAGGLGTWLHYDGRVEIRQESNPSLAGWELFRSAMTGSSTPPVLAPGVMIQIGLLGLAAVYRPRAGGA